MARGEVERESVTATMHYLHRTEKKPFLYMCEPPEGVPQAWGELHTVPDVVVMNGRLMAKPPSLDLEGFEFHRHDTKVRDFYDEEEIRAVYYPEIERLLAGLTGASRIKVFDHTIRSIPRAGAKGMREPARHVHNDYTELSGPQRLREHVSQAEALDAIRRRFLEINVWRPIRGPLEDAPLAVCDAQSIAAEDRIAADLIYADKVTETYSFNFSRGHRWYYFPRMQANEALLFKGYDSDLTARARFTAHTAFDDPTVSGKILPRESIEVRAMVFLPG